jgi:hypothetical protein
VLADYAAMWLGLDGTWEVGTDRGLVLEQADAVRAALAALPAARIGTAGEVADQAASGYERAAAVLGLPKPPTSPATHWWAPLVAALQPGPRDLPTPGRELRGLLSQSGLASLVGG